jgi:hypothetical protein
MIFRLITYFILFPYSLGWCQNFEPKLVFPEKPFENFNCAQFLSDHQVITPYHNSVQIYEYEKKSLILVKRLMLDSDPISISTNQNSIYIVDWSNNLYIFNKLNFTLVKKQNLGFIPKTIKSYKNKFFVLSDSICNYYIDDSVVQSFKFNAKIQGLTEFDHKYEIYTSDGVFELSNNHSLEKRTTLKISKFKKNPFIDEKIFLSKNNLVNEIYNAQKDTIFLISKSIEKIIKLKSYKDVLVVLDSSNVLSLYFKNKIKDVASGVKEFQLVDSILYFLTDDTFKQYNIETLTLINEFSIPPSFDVREILISQSAYLITYSDLSCLVYSKSENHWYRVNQSSGFKGNLLFDQKKIICSGDSQIFRYDFNENKSLVISDLYTFTVSSKNEIIYYGSESHEQVDTVLRRLTLKYDPENETSIDRVEVLDSTVVMRLYNDLLILKYNDYEKVIIGVRYFNKISNHEILYQKNDKIYLLNTSANTEIVLESTSAFMNNSVMLLDSSLLILYSNGKGLRKYLTNKKEAISICYPAELAFSSSFKDKNNSIFFTTWNGHLVRFNDSINTFQVINSNKFPVFAGAYNQSSDLIALADLQGRIHFLSAEDYKFIFTIYNLNDREKLVVDSSWRFDGSPGAIDYLYLTCGLEVIDLAQVKDSLWVPGLVEKIMNNEPILINDRPAPKLSELNICELTPLIEPIENGDKGIFRYQITPRNGGLGETEVYINGNLTYTLMPQQLERKVVNQKEIYFLTISKDSLAPFLVGSKNNLNPLMVKSKVKGASIYGRGVKIDVVKETDEERPSFYGVFVGVNDYGNPTKEKSDLRYRNLDFAKKDADDLANTVEATARNLFDSCHIYRLTGQGIEPNAPTKARLQEVLAEIGKNAKASDELFVFFAGHGDIQQFTNQKEIRFILHKAEKKNLMSTSFGVDELKQWCDPKILKAQKRIFVFDACHSGEIINQTMAFNGRGDEDGLRIRQLDKLKDKNGMMILAAAADNELAYEDETLNQGVLTYHLLEAIKTQKSDTLLTVRDWFDEAIELVKEYSRVNGNQQVPNSFGDGRFEIGNINEQVRQAIEIRCPKTRIGLCMFTDPFGEAKKQYPTLASKINQRFESSGSRGTLVYSKNLDKAYKVVGSYRLEKKKIKVRYEVYLGNEQKGDAIELDPMKGLTEEEMVKRITASIEKEIERIDQRAEKCRLNTN